MGGVLSTAANAADGMDPFWLLAGLTVSVLSRQTFKYRKKLALVWLLMYLYRALTRKQRRRNALKGRVVVITGGAGGLGREIVKRLLAQGATVSVWDISEDQLATIRDQVAHTAQVDVTNRERVLEAGREVLDRLGPVDMLINNAGVQTNRSVLEMREKDISLNFGVNTFAHYWTVQAFLPTMIEQKRGSVVCVSSITSITPPARLSHYAGSKMAASGMMRSLSAEMWEHPELSFTTICPFKIDTAMFTEASTSLIVPPLKVGYVAERILDAAVDGEAVVYLPEHVNWYFYLKNFIPLALHDRVVPYFFKMDAAH